MKNYIKILILNTIVLVSCQKEISIKDLGEYENKIVLNGMIYAGSSGVVNVGKSIGILSTDDKPMILENASVTMTNSNSQSFTFQYDSLGDYSLKDNTFNVGETYDFTVSNEGYSTVNASVSIPPKTNIVSVDTSTSLGKIPDCENCSPENVLKLTMNLKSTTSEKEYFIVSFAGIDTSYYYYVYEYDEDNIIIGYDSVYYDSPKIEKIELQLYSFNSGLKLVKHGSGLEEVFNDGFYYYGKELYFEKPEGITDYSITAYNYGFYPSRSDYGLFFTVVSEDFYKHQLSLARSSYAADDFLAEKVSIYSNIKNGLGILAGANQTIASIKFSEEEE